jgi:hypothetical protein
MVSGCRAGSLCEAWVGLRGHSCRPQSFGTIEVHPVATDPVAAKIEDAREQLIYRDAARLAASLEPTQHQHPIREIAEFLSDALELLLTTSSLSRGIHVRLSRRIPPIAVSAPAG